MILIKGRVYYTIVDIAKKLGVSAKTVRTYICEGIIPEPPVIEYGMRIVKHFPPEYMENALDRFHAHRSKHTSRGKGGGKA
jgi:hypothetical protein